ncbi:MAG: DUF308 domain-containing protein [Christensenellales bacterium]
MATILGALTMIFPQAMIKIVLILLGIGLLVWGAIGLLTVWQKRSVMPQSTLIQGIVCVVGGLILIFAQKNTLSFISFLIGTGAVVWGAVQLSTARSRLDQSLWWLPGGLNIIFGLLNIFLPLVAATVAAFLIGAYITYVGVSVIIWAAFESRHTTGKF